MLQLWMRIPILQDKPWHQLGLYEDTNPLRLQPIQKSICTVIQQLLFYLHIPGIQELSDENYNLLAFLAVWIRVIQISLSSSLKMFGNLWSRLWWIKWWLVSLPLTAHIKIMWCFMYSWVAEFYLLWHNNFDNSKSVFKIVIFLMCAGMREREIGKIWGAKFR